MMPPNAASGSHANARPNASTIGVADRRAARVVVLDDRRRPGPRSRGPASTAESRSSRLLNESSLPWSIWNRTSASGGARRDARTAPPAGAGSRRSAARRPGRTRRPGSPGRLSWRELREVAARSRRRRRPSARTPRAASRSRVSQRCPAGRADLLEHLFVVGGLDHDRHPRVILRGGADQGRPSDVDHLDGLGPRGSAGDRLLERIQVHDDEVERLDRRGLHVTRVVIASVVAEDAREDLRVERLDPSAEDLRKSGLVLDERDVDSRLLEMRGGSSGRDDATPRYPARPRAKVGDPRLVVYGDERAANRRDRPRKRNRLGHRGNYRHAVPDLDVDARGLLCPLPILRLARARAARRAARSRAGSLCRSRGPDTLPTVGRPNAPLRNELQKDETLTSKPLTPWRDDGIAESRPGCACSPTARSATSRCPRPRSTCVS